MDGIGGKAKSMCDEAVALGKDVLCAQDMKNVVDRSQISTFIVNEKNIEEIKNLLPSSIKAVPKTKEIHQLIWTKLKPNELFSRYASCTECSFNECTHYALNNQTTFNLSKEVENLNPLENNNSEMSKVNFNIHDWIIVIYDDIWYPGEVTEIKNNVLIVNFMARGKKYFSWPKTPDIQEVIPPQVLLKVAQPQLTNSKNKQSYKFSNEVHKMIDETAKMTVIYE